MQQTDPPSTTNFSSAPAVQSTTTTAAQAQGQRYRYQNEIQAMMYTFGDVRNPLSTTTLLIEDIVHNQIIQLVKRRSVVGACVLNILSSFILIVD